MIENLKEQWENLTNEYVLRFAKKHDIDIEFELKNNYLWIGNRIGEICCISDAFLNFNDIKYDVDNNIEGDKIFEWYWKMVEGVEFGFNQVNYESYCKGAPEPINKEKLNELKQLRKNAENAKKIFEDAVKNAGGNVGDILFV